MLSLGRRTDGRGIRFSIEIKPSPPKATAGPEALARTVVAALREQGMIERADLLSFDWRILFEARKLVPGLGIVCLSAEQPWLDNVARHAARPSPWTAGLEIEAFRGSLPKMVRATGSGVWGPYYRDLTRETLTEAHAHDLKVVVWTVNEVDEMRSLARLGVDGVTTDYPDRAIEALAPWRSGK